MSDLVRSGKVRYIGISNETPWGTNKYLSLSKENGFERIVSIQNPYSLLNRIYDVGLAEISQHEKIGLLAYSPLGWTANRSILIIQRVIQDWLFGDWFTRYSNDACLSCVKYNEIAERHNLS